MSNYKTGKAGKNNGIAFYNGDTYLVVNGVINQQYTGVVDNGGNYLHITRGIVDEDYTALSSTIMKLLMISLFQLVRAFAKRVHFCNGVDSEINLPYSLIFFAFFIYACYNKRAFTMMSKENCQQPTT